MYYQSYEEYMRDVLGYPRETGTPTYNNFYGMEQRDDDVERLYPEIYRIAYPMVCKACNQFRGEITEDLVCRLTDEVYSNLEVETQTRGEEKTKTEVRTSASKTSTTGKTETKVKEETRQFRPNNTLRDLIRILIIRELLRRRRRPGRPPFSGRPPFPGGPRAQMPGEVQFPNYDVNQFESRYYGNIY